MAEFIPAHPNNFQVGRAGKPILYVVIHSIVGSLNSAVSAFQNPNRIASSTYIVGWDGRVVQMVREEDTPYTNGNFDVNQKSITIEHDDQGNKNIIRPDALYEASARLVADICKRHGIPVNYDRIFGHRDVKAKFGSGTNTECPAALDVNRIIARAQQLAAPPPPPEPEWVLNLQDIGEHTRVLEKAVPLINILTGVVIKDFPTGSEVTVGFKTFTGGRKFYITRYSATNKIPNGFILEDFDYTPPPPPSPEPVPEPIPTPTPPPVDPIEPGPPSTEPAPHPIPMPGIPIDTGDFLEKLIGFIADLISRIFNLGRR